jgi:hypothetical protein
MGLLSFIYLLLKSERPAGGRAGDRTARELTQAKFSDEFFDATSLGCKLQPVRSEIKKDRRR